MPPHVSSYSFVYVCEFQWEPFEGHQTSVGVYVHQPILRWFKLPEQSVPPHTPASTPWSPKIDKLDPNRYIAVMRVDTFPRQRVCGRISLSQFRLQFAWS